MDIPLHASGVGDGLVRLDRDPLMERLRRGQYAPADALAAASSDERYLASVRAAVAARPGAVLARESALALAGLPFGRPTDVFTIGDPATSGSKAGVRNSHVPIAEQDTAVIDGMACASVAHALADIARRGAQLDAVSATDAALRRAAVSRDAILDALTRQGPRGQRRARWVVDFADPRAESVGESWSRVVLARLGAPAPELQARIPTVTMGDRWVDFRWLRPGRRPLAGEFDGFVKYGVIAESRGSTGAKALFDEKRREDAIRSSHDVARWVWGDLLGTPGLARILAAAGLELGQPRCARW